MTKQYKYPPPFSVRLNTNDYQKLRKLAYRQGISAGAIIKMLVKKVIDEPEIIFARTKKK